MTLLGLETSCDETSAAVLDGGGSVLSNIVLSQQDHAAYGGVVPELASRAHLRTLQPVVEQALREAGASLDDLQAVAVTFGPGLVGSLLVGVNFAKALAWARNLALVGVHHLEGHLFSARLGGAGLEPPFAALLVSGGHTELIHVRAWGDYRCLGRTLDDAAGEAFDKVARLLGLLSSTSAVHGGRVVSEAAASGDPRAIDLPRARPDRDGLDFSFSGLKTAVRRRLVDGGGARPSTEDVAASFQEAVVDVLVGRTQEAVESTGAERVALVGGVAANRRLRQRLREALDARGAALFVPEPVLCTDNAAMIAAAGRFRLLRGDRSDFGLDARPRPPLPGLAA